MRRKTRQGRFNPEFIGDTRANEKFLFLDHKKQKLAFLIVFVLVFILNLIFGVPISARRKLNLTLFSNSAFSSPIASPAIEFFNKVLLT